jgi:hypothetical protein
MKSARVNIKDTVMSLKEVKQYLNDAASTVENGHTRKRIEEQLSAVETCLNECQTMSSTVKEP